MYWREQIWVFFWNIHWYVGLEWNNWICKGRKVWRRVEGVFLNFTSWHSALLGRHPPLLLAAADATGQSGGGGWPACQTSVSVQPPWTCFPPKSSRWHRSCQSCHNLALWWRLGFSEETGGEHYNLVQNTMKVIGSKGLEILCWFNFLYCWRKKLCTVPGVISEFCV